VGRIGDEFLDAVNGGTTKNVAALATIETNLEDAAVDFLRNDGCRGRYRQSRVASGA